MIIRLHGSAKVHRLGTILLQPALIVLCANISARIPAAFVVSLNLKRRHLSESQRAMVAAKLANMPRGGDRQEQHRANLHSASTAAVMLNVGRASVHKWTEALAGLR